MKAGIDPHRARTDQDQTGLRAAVRGAVDGDGNVLVTDRRQGSDIALGRAADEEPAEVRADRAGPQLLGLLEVAVAVSVVVHVLSPAFN